MEVILLSQALDDRDYWLRVGNKTILKRITNLLRDISAHPFTGIGNPEPLKHDLAGLWSRRINREHHIVYSVKDDRVVYVFTLCYHYK